MTRSERIEEALRGIVAARDMMASLDAVLSLDSQINRARAALAAPREDEQAPGATGTICVECGKRAMQPAVRVCSGCGAWTFNGDGARVLDEVKREDAEKRGGRCDACGGDGYTSGFRKCPACAGSGKQGGGTT